MSLPVLIFVPGAYHPPESFGKVVPKLEVMGFRCMTLSLPGVGRKRPIKDLSYDIVAVRDPVVKEIEAGNDVVVICHSWGGIVVTSALEGLGKGEGAQNGQKNGVVKILFIAAFMLPKGDSIVDAIGGPPKAWDMQSDLVYARSPLSTFYHDVDKTEAEYWVSQLKPQALATFFAKGTGEAHLKIPSSYLICEDDKAISAELQESFVKKAQDAGGTVNVERTAGSHSPFLTKPDVVVDFVKRSVEN